MVLNPTVVVGIGAGGCKMTGQIYEEVREMAEGGDDEGHSLMDDFLFIAIDTRKQDLDNIEIDAFHELLLEPQRQLWNKDRHEYPYIHDGIDDMDPGGGASRQRPTARYYIDNAANFDDVYTELNELIGGFSDDIDRNPNLWVLNSYGGGTGSGAFPLLTAMLEEIAENASKPFWIGGIGSLPRLDQLETNPQIPAESKNLYANAYTALRELCAMVGYEFRDPGTHTFSDAAGADGPLTIPLQTNSSVRAKDHFEIDGSPYDFYGLMGLDEGKDSDHKRVMNRIAANTVLYFSELGGLEDFGDDFISDPEKPVLYSIDSSGVEVPVDQLGDYTDLVDELEGVTRRLREARRAVNEARANRDVLRKVIDSAGEFGDDREVNVELLEHVDEDGEPAPEQLSVDVDGMVTDLTSIYQYAAEATESFEKMQFSEQLVDDREEKLLNDVPTTGDDITFNTEPIARFFFYKGLEAEYEALESEHTFPEKLNSAWEDYREEIARSDSIEVDTGQLDDASPLVVWDEAVSEFMDLKIQAIENAIENTSRLFGRDKRKKLRRRLDQWEGDRAALRSEARSYRRIAEGGDTAETRATNARKQLRNYKNRYEQELTSDLESREKSRGDTHNALLNRRRRLESTLSEFDESRFANIPFSNFEEVSQGILDRAGTIVELEETGVVSPTDIVGSTRHVIDLLDETLEDVETVRVTPETVDYLGLMAHEDNASIVNGEYDSGVPGDGVAQASGKFNRDNDSESVPLQDGYSLRMVGLFTKIRLENTSEFGTFHQLYRGTENVAGQFGKDGLSDDEFVTAKFAYPEFFPDDEQIQSYYGYETVANDD